MGLKNLFKSKPKPEAGSDLVFVQQNREPYFRKDNPVILPNRPVLMDPGVNRDQLCLLQLGEVVAQMDVPALHDMKNWQLATNMLRMRINLPGVNVSHYQVCVIRCGGLDTGNVVGLRFAPSVVDLNAWQATINAVRSALAGKAVL